MTVGDFLLVWLADVVTPTVRPKTRATYETLVRVHLIPAFGHVPLVRLTPQDVQRALNERLGSGLSPRTVRHILVVLRTALGQASRWDLVSRNVATLVEPPRVATAEVRPMTADEARTFLEVSSGDRLHALYAVALLTGLRQGEALGLRWHNLDLDQATLRVEHALQRVAGRLSLVEPKTRRSKRVVVLSPRAVDALRGHRAEQLRERLLAGERWTETGLVFTTTIGTPLDGPAVTRRLQRILAGAGMRPQRFHDLRHTCASLLLLDGVHPRVVMEMLGHSQISLTMDTYTHVAPELQRAASLGLDQRLARAGSR
jgi:integrase